MKRAIAIVMLAGFSIGPFHSSADSGSASDSETVLQNDFGAYYARCNDLKPSATAQRQQCMLDLAQLDERRWAMGVAQNSRGAHSIEPDDGGTDPNVALKSDWDQYESRCGAVTAANADLYQHCVADASHFIREFREVVGPDPHP